MRHIHLINLPASLVLEEPHTPHHLLEPQTDIQLGFTNKHTGG